MESFWRGAGVQLGRQWKVVVVVLVAITVVLGIGLTRAEFATGEDSYLNPDSQVALDNVEFQGNFGGETVIMLFTAPDDGDVDVTALVDPGNVEILEALEAELREVDNVRSVITPYTSLTFSDSLLKGPGQAALLSAASRDEEGAGVRGEDVTASLERLGAIPAENQVLGDPDWNDLLVFDNAELIRKSLASTFPDKQTESGDLLIGKVAVGGVVMEGNIDLDAQSEATDEILNILADVELEGFELTVTGSPVYLKEINDYLQGGFLTLGAIALVVMAVVLALMFRVRWRLLPLLAVLVGVVWTFSLLGWIGIDLSLVTISGLPILIGLGIDFAIQVHNRIAEETELDHEVYPMAETLANLAPALLAATFAGFFSFLALRLSKVPMIRDFGVLLAIGVVVLVIIGIVLPAAMLAIGTWKPREGDGGPSLVERIVVKLGSLPTKAGLGLLIASVFLFVGGILVEGRTEIESDPIEWIDQGSEVVQDVRFLEDETGFATTLGILVQANNTFDQDVVDLIWEFTLDAEERDEVVSSSSLVNTMGKIILIDGATPIAPTVDDVVGAAGVAPPDIAQALFTEDGTATQINLRLAPASLEERAVLVDELEDDLEARIDALGAEIETDSILLADLPEGQDPVRATPSGLATVGIGLLENLSANRAALTYFALSLAALFLVLRFRSPQRALLALVPVFLAVGVSSLIVGLAGITLSPLTTVSGPLVIASCTEFSVLILGRYLEERQSGLDPRTATDTAAARTGRAFFTSALTTIGGFAVLIASPLPLLRDFGLIVTLNVAIALLAALVLMPPMMVWVDQRGWLKVDRQVGEYGALKLAADMEGGAVPAFAIGTVAAAGAAVAVYSIADTSSDSASDITYTAVALPTTTTTTTTTTVPDETGGETDGPAVDPADYPSDPPTGLAAPILFGLLTDQGVEPNVANCAIDQMFTRAGGEQALIDLGLVSGTEESLEIVRAGAADCGVTFEQTEAAIEAQFGPDATLPAPEGGGADAPDGGTAVDPSEYPTERPTGVAAPILFDLLIDQGVEPNVANCAIDQMFTLAGDEQALIGLGLVTGTDEALAIVREGAELCGVTEEQTEAAIEAQFG